MSAQKPKSVSELVTQGRITNGITVTWSNSEGLHIHVLPKIVEKNDFGKVLGRIGGMSMSKGGKAYFGGSAFNVNGKTMILKLEAVLPNKELQEKPESIGMSEPVEL